MIKILHDNKELIRKKKSADRDFCLKFYTDGSLKSTVDQSNNIKETKMGAGWINADMQSQRFRCQLMNWPSSTRAELTAIWTALLTAPKNVSVRIYTDSQAAIDNIDMATNSKRKADRLIVNNNTLTWKIKDIVAAKELDVVYVKVKGHSGNVLNDKADEQTKMSLRGNLIEIDSKQVLDSYISPFWNGLSVERPLRNFIKQRNEQYVQYEWSLNRTNRELLRAEKPKDCSVAWNLARSLKDNNCRSMKTHYEWIFQIKTLNDLLPTRSMMNEFSDGRYPLTLCPLCGEDTETIEHLTKCKELTESWENVFKKSVTKVINKLNKDAEQEEKFSSKNFINKFSPFTKYINAHTEKINTKTEIHEWLKGVFKPHQLEAMKRFFPTNNCGFNAISHISKKILRYFKREIWPKRCKVNKMKEEAQLPNANSNNVEGLRNLNNAQWRGNGAKRLSTKNTKKGKKRRSVQRKIKDTTSNTQRGPKRKTDRRVE